MIVTAIAGAPPMPTPSGEEFKDDGQRRHRTVQRQSWAGLKNGQLLDAAEAAGFTVLVTGDRNLQFQQNLAK